MTQTELQRTRRIETNMNFDRPWAYVIEEDVRDEHGFIPVAVFEDNPNRYPATGNGPEAQPWYWGKTLEAAWRVADQVNAERGVTREEAMRIRISSIVAGIQSR